MIEIGIKDFNSSPSIIDKLDEVAKIVNKKTKDIKGYFIPFSYRDKIAKVIEEIEYQKFKEKNTSLSEQNDEYDDTLLDGLSEKY